VLTPTHSQLPAKVMLRSLAQYPLKLLSLFQHLLRFIAQGKRVLAKEIYQRADGDEAILSGKPLRWGQSLRPLGIARSFFKEKRHRVFIRGEEIEDWPDAQTMCQLLQRIFVSGQCATIHKDVVSGILTFHDDVHGRSHASSLLHGV